MGRKLLIWMTALLSLLGAGCRSPEGPKLAFTIVSGSENKSLEPILQEFGRKNGVDIHMKYMGSVEIMHELEQSRIPYDAVWPASSLWIGLGDRSHVVKLTRSIMTTPVVFGIRKSLAERLGFVDADVHVRDILEAIKTGKLKFAMTSATQSNSGTSAYLGFLYAFLGNPDMISSTDLQSPQLHSQIKTLFSGVSRSSGSSGWLKDLFLKGDYDSMVNYEAMVIEANQELVTRGKEPLYVVYPVDGIVIADSPLGYVNNGDASKEAIFKKLQDYLLSDDVQGRILDMGRRTGFGGVAGKADPKVFNREWGVDLDRILAPIKYPAADVLMDALHLYQSELRKPSFTVFCLDFSGSMRGQGEADLKNAMKMLLDQELAKQNFLEASPGDRIVVIPFNNSTMKVWSTTGNSPQGMSGLLQQIVNLTPGGGTDIYSPVIESFFIMTQTNLEGYIPAVILMTDGKSNEGRSFKDLQQAWRTVKGKDIPVFSILFGEASGDQLGQIADLTRGRIFDGRKDLAKAFREAKGYN
ncbi:MAG: substrate-binding domain-containing protein [Syntrophobacteraceae bacterium]